MMYFCSAVVSYRTVPSKRVENQALAGIIITSRCRAHRFFTPSPGATVDKHSGKRDPAWRQGRGGATTEKRSAGRAQAGLAAYVGLRKASTSITFSTSTPNTPLTPAIHHLSTHSLPPSYIYHQPIKYCQNGRHQAGEPPSPHRLPTPQFCFSTGLSQLSLPHVSPVLANADTMLLSSA